MTDYYEPQYPNYAPHHQPYYGDPGDENEIRRTATRGSHQSQATASTKSWVQQTQRHPPPPPPGVEDLPPQSRPPSQGTAFHGPRPIPERHSGKRPVTRYVQHADDEDETFDTGDDPMVPGALRFGYQSDDLGNGRPIQAGPSTLGPSTPMLAPIAPLQIQHKKTFVGGFFKGLKKIPKIVLGRGEKGGLRRRGTFGTDGTTLTAVSHGNTLPRYLSNPSIGPSNPQFAHRLSMAVANGSLPPEATPAVFQMRTNPQPRYPEVVVTPPSAEGMPGESVRAEFYDGPPPEEEPEYHEQEESHTDPRERTTVMVYNTDSQAPTVTQGPSSQPTRPPSAPRVSYPRDLPTRATTQSQSEHFNPPPISSPPPQSGPSSAIHYPSPRYAAPNSNPVGRHRNQLLSPVTTSGGDYTSTSGLTSHYDPSFASSLGPIEKFFKGLYHLPWIGHNRITVDYRPGDTARAKGKMRILNNPKLKPSWYRSMAMALSRRNSVDPRSSEGGETMSPRSFGYTLSRFGSPLSRRSGRSSERRHHHHHHHHHSSRTKHRHRRRRTATSAATTTDVPHRVGSPIVPTVYPYAVPPYLPYTYPYMPYATMPMPDSSPRGQRSKSHRRAAKYPHGGYAAYQPMAMPPPPVPVPAPMQPAPSGQALYYMGPSPPQSQNSGDAPATAGQPMMQAAAAGVSLAQGPMQFSSPTMPYVPASYAQNLQAGNTMISPPVSPQRPRLHPPS